MPTTSVPLHPNRSSTSTTSTRLNNWPISCAPSPPTVTAITRTSGGRARASISTPSSGAGCVPCYTRPGGPAGTVSTTVWMTGGEAVGRVSSRWRTAKTGCHGVMSTWPTYLIAHITVSGQTVPVHFTDQQPPSVHV